MVGLLVRYSSNTILFSIQYIIYTGLHSRIGLQITTCILHRPISEVDARCGLMPSLPPSRVSPCRTRPTVYIPRSSLHHQSQHHQPTKAAATSICKADTAILPWRKPCSEVCGPPQSPYCSKLWSYLLLFIRAL